MRKLKILILLPLLLAGCKTEEEKKSEWIAFCTQGDFTAKQCNVLYSMKKDASDDAANNAAMTGMAIGMSVGSTGARR